MSTDKRAVKRERFTLLGSRRAAGAPLTVFPSLDEVPRFVLILTKPYLVTTSVLRSSPLRKEALAIVRDGSLGEMITEILRVGARKNGVTVGFVGDLDPTDLQIFATYRRRERRLRRTARASVLDVRYLGIDDEWLAVCENYMREPFVMDSIVMKMPRREYRALESVRMALPLEETVGARSVALLSEGRKVELEGASNPMLYRRGFKEAIEAHLLSRLTAE